MFLREQEYGILKSNTIRTMTLVSIKEGGTMKRALTILLAVALAAAVIVYFVSVIALRGITREDMKLIPGGEKVAKILHMR